MNVFVVDGCRTPMGKLGGQLAGVRPDDLAAQSIKGLLARNAGIPRRAIDDVFWGAANQAGEDNRNVGRMAVLLAGLPVDVPGTTVNRLCGSGMQAVLSAAQALAAGDGSLMIGGGSESMSRAPYAQLKAQAGFRPGAPEIADTVLGWRFVNPTMQEMYPPITLGMGAELAGERYGVSRGQQDEFALRSHHRALAAQKEGRFDSELMSIEATVGPRFRDTTEITMDEGPRADSDLDALGKLPPVFKEDGTVTAGNSSPMNDGAAALLLATEDALSEHGLTPLARIVDGTSAGVHPDYYSMGPVPATEKLIERNGMSIDQVDLVELNEAFAAQSVACIQELNLDPEIVNVNGGAIALGHPLGCSGARIVATLAHEMKRRDSKMGLATMCIGVGQGISMIIEKV